MLGGVPFAPGEPFVFYSGGGGGWGSALERDPELVAEDVRNEIVSPKAARDTYGVVLTDDGQVDMDATTAAGRARRRLTPTPSPGPLPRDAQRAGRSVLSRRDGASALL
jgi:hypothetical protein